MNIYPPPPLNNGLISAMTNCMVWGLLLVLIELLEQLVEVHSNDPEEAIFPLIDFSGVVNVYRL